MFDHKIRLIFEKLLLRQTIQNRTSTVPLKKYNLEDKVYFRHHLIFSIFKPHQNHDDNIEDWQRYLHNQGLEIQAQNAREHITEEQDDLL